MSNKSYIGATIVTIVLAIICGFLVFSLSPDSSFSLEVPQENNAEYFTYMIVGKGFLPFQEGEYHKFPYTINELAYSGSKIDILIKYYNTSYSVPPNGTNLNPALEYNFLGDTWITFTVGDD